MSIKCCKVLLKKKIKLQKAALSSLSMDKNTQNYANESFLMVTAHYYLGMENEKLDFANTPHL